MRWPTGPNCAPINSRQLFHLKRERMPHYSTWSRVLGHAVEPAEVEHVLGQFFLRAVRRSERKRGQPATGVGWQNLAGNDPPGSQPRGAIC